MKNPSLNFLSVGVVCSLLLSSCISGMKAQKERADQMKVARESNSPLFVVFNDGRTKNFSSLEFVARVKAFADYKSGLPYLLGDKKEKIVLDSIRGYQLKDYYADKVLDYNGLTQLSGSYEALLGFGKRVIKGKISLYFERHFEQGAFSMRSQVAGGDKVYVENYYLKKGENGNISLYWPDNLRDMVKDNAQAAELAKKKKFTVKEAIQIINVYNN